MFPLFRGLSELLSDVVPCWEHPQVSVDHSQLHGASLGVPYVASRSLRYKAKRLSGNLGLDQ
ncbi:hypothetical protein I79_019139 [Cricetulus griseus]|uniref:Uncharacterized protein n=1 Tax=Cricetulus griseus TaxID=10029 RepID=G3I6L4_CRIGR|nr:hypothetical protein I79_019139 [Cricetulus griseus]